MKTVRRSILVLCALIAATAGYLALSVLRDCFHTTTSNKMEKHTFKIIAHRGGAGLGAENTLSCIERGIAAGADIVEIDVHLTADGVPVVCHDPTVDRTTDGRGRIADLTLEQIRQLRVTAADNPVVATPTVGNPDNSNNDIPGRTTANDASTGNIPEKNSVGIPAGNTGTDSTNACGERSNSAIAMPVADTPAAERIPTLGEVLETVGDKAEVLIEIKKSRRGNNADIECKVLAEIRRCGAENRVTIQSFNDSVLERFHRLAPEIRLEKLFICKLWGLPVIFDGGFTRFSFEKYAYVSSFNIYHRSLTPRLLEGIHRRGQQVKLWTADDPERVSALPFDGVITNRPDLWAVKRRSSVRRSAPDDTPHQSVTTPTE